ncbi:MAG: hypothetical protein N2444_02015, partial [Methylocystis sp.]|nr:hypothetical protein [Methylocystis sp.]
DAATAYAETRAPCERPDETVVSSTHHQSAKAAEVEQPTMPEEPKSGLSVHGKSSRAKSEAGIPLPPSRSSKARGKEARAEEAISGAMN